MTKSYAQLAREIEALQASANKARAQESQAAIARINQSIALYGLTAEDLRFEGIQSAASPAPGRQQAKASSSPAASAAKSSDAKFSNGNGQVWSGRGPRPIWLRNALLQGRTLESFAVSASGAAGKTTATPARSADAKPVTKLPALFQHAKTGKTWSGRGPQPAWLKQGLKKRGATLDDFRIAKAGTPSSAPETPAAPVTEPIKTPVAATKKAPAAKKAAAAKKAPATKKSTTASVKSSAAPAPTKKAVAKKAAAKKSAAPAKTASPAAPEEQTAPASTSGSSPTANPAAKKATPTKKAPASKKAAVKATPAKKSKSQPASDNGSSDNNAAAPEPTANSSSDIADSSKPVKTWDF